MRRLRHLVAATLIVAVGSSAAFAQQSHIVDQASVAEVIRQHTDREEKDRATIREALARPEVRSVAEKSGIDVERLSAAVNTMSAADAARAADSARKVNQSDQSFVGGASTITISTTTIIIALLILILLIVAID